MLYRVGMHCLCDLLLLSYKGTFLKKTLPMGGMFQGKISAFFILCSSKSHHCIKEKLEM